MLEEAERRESLKNTFDFEAFGAKMKKIHSKQVEKAANLASPKKRVSRQSPTKQPSSIVDTR